MKALFSNRLLCAALIALAAGPVLAQAYPTKTVKVVAGFPPGGAADLLARLVADKLSAALGQPFVVENRPGAGGTIGADAVAKAAGDGYTLLLGAAASQAIAPSIYKSLPYDAARDFKAVALVATIPITLVVHPSVPANSARELVAVAKAAPAPMQYASSGSGAMPHLAGELFQFSQGVKLQHVPYKGAPLAMSDLLSGRVQIMFDNLPTVLAHIRSGKLRALAVAADKRARALPDLPTLAEAGVPGAEVGSWFGVLAPGATPDAIVAALARELARVVASEDGKARMEAMGAEPAYLAPDAFEKLIRADTAKWARLVKATGAQVD
ncbi:MAG: tripartite tricarboxylate transporter substrate binding protein [Betaproteobacteria bacterium]|nr:tripartite tricarboxylate transporter substrate binding protein [Betaproteobacteria bacterium]